MGDPYWLNSAFCAMPWFFGHGYDVLPCTLPFHGSPSHPTTPCPQPPKLAERFRRARQLDHVSLPVNDPAARQEFYFDVLGFTDAGEEGPFKIVRAGDESIVLLSEDVTEGNVHLAFAMSKAEFDVAFDRIKESGAPYGDSYHSTTNGNGPAPEIGARGPTMSLYLNDPSNHLIEFLYYED